MRLEEEFVPMPYPSAIDMDSKQISDFSRKLLPATSETGFTSMKTVKRQLLHG
jgi:hypothetical protein